VQSQPTYTHHKAPVVNCSARSDAQLVTDKTFSTTHATATALSSLLTAIFPREPGLAGFMMEVVVTTGARSRAKFRSNRHHQQTNIQHFSGRMPFLSPNRVTALNGKIQ